MFCQTILSRIVDMDENHIKHSVKKITNISIRSTFAAATRNGQNQN